MNHLSDIICITCCGSASTQTIIPSDCEKRQRTQHMALFWKHTWVCMSVNSSLYNMLPSAWNSDSELLQPIGSQVICFAEQATWAKQLTAFTWKQKVKHLPTCLHKHPKSAHTCTDKNTDTHATIWLYQKQTYITLCSICLSDCLSEQNERAERPIKMQGWWMKGMAERQEKGRRRGEDQRGERRQKSTLLCS